MFFQNRAIHGVLVQFWLFEYESFVLVASVVLVLVASCVGSVVLYWMRLPVVLVESSWWLPILCMIYVMLYI